MASESKNSRKPLVGIIMGSDTDLPVMSETAKICLLYTSDAADE